MRARDYLRVYQTLCPADKDIEPARAKRIIAEMRALATYAKAIDAREAVEWWPWDNRQEMDSWIRRARKLIAEMEKIK